MTQEPRDERDRYRNEDAEIRRASESSREGRQGGNWPDQHRSEANQGGSWNRNYGQNSGYGQSPGYGQSSGTMESRRSGTSSYDSSQNREAGWEGERYAGTGSRQYGREASQYERPSGVGYGSGGYGPSTYSGERGQPYPATRYDERSSQNWSGTSTEPGRDDWRQSTDLETRGMRQMPSEQDWRTRQRRPMGDYIGRGPRNYARSDQRISEDVCQMLTDEPLVDASDIVVTVMNGEVTLSGTVSDREQRRRAEDAAENVAGVSHVQNNLRLERGRYDVPRDETESLISSDKVEGTAVYGADREKIGKIETLMLTKRTGRVAYVVLSFGGFLGLGSDHYPLPWSALRYDEDLGGYVVNLTKEQLQNAPKFTQQEGWDWGNPETARRIDRYYSPLIGIY